MAKNRQKKTDQVEVADPLLSPSNKYEKKTPCETPNIFFGLQIGQDTMINDTGPCSCGSGACPCGSGDGSRGGCTGKAEEAYAW